MSNIAAQYKDILIQAQQGEGGIADIKIFLTKAKKPANSNTTLTKLVECAIAGKTDLKNLDLSWATDFQKRVYREMVKIKPGKTMSYAELAEKIGVPKAYRAVASACARNRLPLLIPCHRVVASNGGLGGYSAEGGLKMKKYLLELESDES